MQSLLISFNKEVLNESDIDKGINQGLFELSLTLRSLTEQKTARK